MSLETSILFQLFRAITILFALLVVVSRSPMQSVFSLIIVFCSVSGLTILIQAEFIALSFIIIYVGAIAVLFLFVIMMLNTKIEELQSSYLVNFPYSTFIITIFVSQISAIFFASTSKVLALHRGEHLWGFSFSSSEGLSMEAIGNVLYTHHALPLILASFILFAAMVGSIALTLVYKKRTYRDSFREKVIKHLYSDGPLYRRKEVSYFRR